MSEQISTHPAPGPWLDHLTGLPAQLVAVQQGVCWFSTARSHNLFPMLVAEWLKSMRQAQ